MCAWYELYMDVELDTSDLESAEYVAKYVGCKVCLPWRKTRCVVCANEDRLLYCLVCACLCSFVSVVVVFRVYVLLDCFLPC